MSDKISLNEYRIETDSMGEVKVPSYAYWGAQTQRSIDNFKIGMGTTMPPSVIEAIIEIKRAAAKANHKLGKLQTNLHDAIVSACNDLLQNDCIKHFPLVVWQTGSGTQTNMNVNEVIANKANEILGQPLGTKSPVHPNDHVNYGQSSNDTFPTAMHVATYKLLTTQLIPALRNFSITLDGKINEFKAVIKIARTHMQDATPITVGQEFSAFKRQIDGAIERLEATFPRLLELAQGGTAVGTGLNCPKGFSEIFCQYLNASLEANFKPALNFFESLATHDTLLEVSGMLNVLAASLMKIANDIRLLGSGPRCGLNELYLPENEPGSSIMPGKVNPTQAEAMTMVCAQVMGNNTAITIAASQGHLQLNVYKPIIIKNVVESISLLTDAINSFNNNCLKGITLNTKQINQNVANSLMLVTALNTVIGYENAAKVAKKALHDQISLSAAANELGLLTEFEFNQHVRPETMV